jgi:hypothetical protein
MPASRTITWNLDEDRGSLRLVCSQTAISGVKSPSPSCTMDSKSPIWRSEHLSKRSPSNAPIHSFLSRSSRSWDPASLRWYRNSSRTEQSSGVSRSNSALQFEVYKRPSEID